MDNEKNLNSNSEINNPESTVTNTSTDNSNNDSVQGKNLTGGNPSEPPKKPKFKLDQKLKNRLLLISSIVCAVIFLVCILWNPIISPYFQHKALDTVYTDVLDDNLDKDDIAKNIKKLKDAKEDFDFDDINLLTSSLKNLSPKIDKSLIVGEIQVPAVNIHLPILYGTNNQNLLTSATTMKKDQKMGEGNYALAGHNAPDETILFAPLHKSKKGEYIYITDKQKLYTYVIDDIRVVHPSETSVIEDIDGEKMVTLVTCYDPKGKTRLIIQGSLVKKEAYKDGMKLAKSEKE